MSKLDRDLARAVDERIIRELRKLQENSERCSCPAHCAQCGACSVPLNEQNFCERCMIPVYRWLPRCSCGADLASFTTDCTACLSSRRAS